MTVSEYVFECRSESVSVSESGSFCVCERVSEYVSWSVTESMSVSVSASVSMSMSVPVFVSVSVYQRVCRMREKE